MRRKVIQIADSTLLVSMPKKWADANNVKKGDEVQVTPSENSLLITLDSKPQIEIAYVNNLEDFGSMARRYLHALYKKGIDEIHVTFKRPMALTEIQDGLSFRNSAVGYEIVEQSTNHCVIKNVGGQPGEFNMLLRRVFLLMSTMSKEGFTALKVGNIESLKHAAELERSNNRLTTICRRYINKKGQLNYSHIGPLYHIVEELEALADEYKYLFVYLANFDKKSLKLSPQFYTLYEEVDKMWTRFSSVFYKFDAKQIAEISETRKSLVDQCIKMMEDSKNKQEIIACNHLFVIVQRIFNMVSPYLVIAETLNLNSSEVRH